MCLFTDLAHAGGGTLPLGSRFGKPKKGGLSGEHFQFAGLEKGDNAIFAVIARFADYLPVSQAAQPFGECESGGPLRLVNGHVAQDMEFRAQAL